MSRFPSLSKPQPSHPGASALEEGKKKADFALATTLAMTRSAEITKNNFPKLMTLPPEKPPGQPANRRSGPHPLHIPPQGTEGLGGRTATFPSVRIVHEQLQMILRSWNVPVNPKGTMDPQDRTEKLQKRFVSLKLTFWRFFLENAAEEYVAPLQEFMRSVEELIAHLTEQLEFGQKGLPTQPPIDSLVVPPNFVPKQDLMAAIEKARTAQETYQQETEKLRTDLQESEADRAQMFEILKERTQRNVRKAVGVQGKESDFPRVLYLEKMVEDKTTELEMIRPLLEKYKKSAEENRAQCMKLNVQATESATRLKVMHEIISKLTNKVNRYEHHIKVLEKENVELQKECNTAELRGPRLEGWTALKKSVMNEKNMNSNTASELQSAEPTLPESKRRLVRVGKGVIPNVPYSLRHQGAIEIMDLSKEQVDAIVANIWQHRSAKLSESVLEGNLETTTFAKFLQDYFERRYNDRAPVWAYSVYEAAKYFENDVNLMLFRVLMQNKVGERLVSEFNSVVQQFIQMCDRCDIQVNGQENRKYKTHCKHVHNCLLQLFPSAPQKFMIDLLQSARELCCTKDNEILYGMLFPTLGNSRRRRIVADDTFSSPGETGYETCGIQPIHSEAQNLVTETRFSRLFKEGILMDNLTANTFLRDCLSMNPKSTIRDVRGYIRKCLQGNVSDYETDTILSVINGGSLPSPEQTVSMPDYMTAVKERIVLRSWTMQPSQVASLPLPLSPKSLKRGESMEKFTDESTHHESPWVWWKSSEAKDLDYEAIFLLAQDSQGPQSPRGSRKMKPPVS